MEKSFETNNVLHFLLWEIKCSMEKIIKHMEIVDQLLEHGLVQEKGESE